MKRICKCTSGVLAAIMVLTLAACGGSGAGTGTTAGASAAPASEAAAPAGTQAPAGTTAAATTAPMATLAPAVTEAAAPKGEQILRVARDYEGDSYDPATYGSYNDYLFGPIVFETLVQFDENYDILPKLADSWEVSDDALTYTFHLKKGVQFHYGYGEFTSKDVQYSIKRLGDPAVNGSMNYVSLGVENMASIDAPDDYTVVITLKELDPNFLVKMASHYGNIVSQKAVEDMGLEKFSLRPVGTGAFMVAEGAVIGEHSEVLRFDGYWGDKAILDKITFQVISEPATLYTAFESGEVDQISMTDFDKLAQYQAAPDKYNIYIGPSRSMLYIGNNMSIAPFDDPRVREAFTLAIDREGMIEDYFLGLPNAAGGIIPAPCMYSLKDYFNPTYDPAKAKELLAEAGYPNGFTTTFYCPGDATSLGPATVLQSYLEAAGIHAELQTVDFGVFLDKVRAGEAPIWLIYNDTNISSEDTIRRYMSENYPGNNWSGINDPAYDEAAAAALNEKDVTKRPELFEKAQKILNDLNAVYTVCDSAQYNITAKKVKGLEFRPDLAIRFDKVYIEE